MTRTEYLTLEEIRIELANALREGKNPFNSASQETVKYRVIKNTEKKLRGADWEKAVAQALQAGEIERVPNAPARIRLTVKGQDAIEPRSRLTLSQLRAGYLRLFLKPDSSAEKVC